MPTSINRALEDYWEGRGVSIFGIVYKGTGYRIEAYLRVAKFLDNQENSAYDIFKILSEHREDCRQIEFCTHFYPLIDCSHYFDDDFDYRSFESAAEYLYDTVCYSFEEEEEDNDVD